VSRPLTYVFTFGRFQPPTKGHYELLKELVEAADMHGTTGHVYISPSQDSIRNPLSWAERVKLVRDSIPYRVWGLSIAAQQVKTPIDVLDKIVQEGVYDAIEFWVGDDRADFGRYAAKLEARVRQTRPQFTIRIMSTVRRNDVSGTMMRAAAASGDFETFKAGLPAKLAEFKADVVFRKVRAGMGYSRGLTHKPDSITESVDDKYIFKAVFVVGPPGSGKSFVVRRCIQGLGLKELNSDIAYEFLMHRNNLSLKHPEHEAPARVAVRARSNELFQSTIKSALDGRLGVIYNGTGSDFEATKNMYRLLDMLGYDCMMLFVNTTNAISRARNEGRGRSIPETIRATKWKEIQANLGKFQQLFGPERFVIVDNSIDVATNATVEEDYYAAFKRVRRFCEAPVRDQTARRWIAYKKAPMAEKTLTELRREFAETLSEETTEQDNSDAGREKQRQEREKAKNSETELARMQAAKMTDFKKKQEDERLKARDKARRKELGLPPKQEPKKG
jgi:hypothetical protein